MVKADIIKGGEGYQGTAIRGAQQAKHKTILTIPPK
jgi:hypothetical protein